MEWLQQHSFDDCESKHDTPGFLSAAELTEQLQTFAALGDVEYTAGLTANGLTRLLKKLLDEQVQLGLLYGAETTEAAGANVENFAGGPRKNVQLWRLRPRGVSESELQQQADVVDVTVAALRRKALGVAAASGDEQLAALARVMGEYQPGLVRLRSMVQVVEAFNNIIDSGPTLWEMTSFISAALRAAEAPLIAALGGAAPASTTARMPARLAALPPFSPALGAPVGPQLTTKEVVGSIFEAVSAKALPFLLNQRRGTAEQLNFLAAEQEALLEFICRQLERAGEQLLQSAAEQRGSKRRTSLTSDASLQRGVLRHLQVHVEHIGYALQLRARVLP